MYTQKEVGVSDSRNRFNVAENMEMDHMKEELEMTDYPYLMTNLGINSRKEPC